MAKMTNAQQLAQGGVRRKRNTPPRLDTDGAVVKYNVQGSVISSDANGLSTSARYYVPGYTGGLSNPSGPNLVQWYSTGKFEPGTTVRWEPSVSFTTTGRVIVGWTDNPEVIASLIALTGTTYVNAVKSLGSAISFPVWQETEIKFPTRLRRKRFDVNATVSVTAVDVLDRCCQTAMFVAFEGAPASISLGNFWYRDRVNVEGLHGLTT